MSVAFRVAFWLCAALVLYVYFGYPLLVFLLSKVRKRPVVKEDITPSVSFIIAAYNEEAVIAQKIENCLASSYPPEKLEVLIGSDGSTDATDKIVTQYARRERRVKLIAAGENQGKSAIQNDIVAKATGDILIFSDAPGMIETTALQDLVRYFADKSVGCVSGTARDTAANTTSVARANSLYFAYEDWLRKNEGEIRVLAMGCGALLAVRRSLYRPLPWDVGDDFVTPMSVVERGYRVVFDPQIYARDEIANSTRGKFQQKERVITKDMRGLLYKRALLNPFRYPLVAWSLTSHKLLRWLVPVWLIFLLVANLFLLDIPFYRLTLSGQLAFYLFALIGWGMQVAGKKIKVFYIPFYFCLLNAAALKGLINLLSGVRMGRWEPER